MAVRNHVANFEAHKLYVWEVLLSRLESTHCHPPAW